MDFSTVKDPFELRAGGNSPPAATAVSPATGRPLVFDPELNGWVSPGFPRPRAKAATGGFIPSAQQAAFLAEIRDADRHVQLRALAGCGKSTTAREGMKALRAADPTCRPVYVAFNRAIADDFQRGLPPGCSATTMHAMGYAAIRAAVPGVGEPARHKMYDIVDGLLPRRDHATRKAKQAIVKLAGLCKGYLIDGTDPDRLDRLAAAHGIDLRTMRATVLPRVPQVLERCRKQSSVVDFSDMVWLPVVLEMDFPACDALFIDEAQDLDPCQHALVRRIAGDGRIVFIGDPMQAIYSFRGADARSMDTLADQLAATPRGLATLPLTMTRRCPKAHVELCRGLVPEFEALPEAPEGELAEDAGVLDTLTPGVMALCRTNAPLVAACYGLAAAGVPVAIQGRDIGEGLAKFVEGFGCVGADDLMDEVERYRAAEVVRLSALENSEGEVESVEDRCGCVIAVAAGCQTAADVAGKVRSLFLDVTPANQGRLVLLSSIHRAKGRESSRVAILEPSLLPHKMARTPEAMEQEGHLAYVAATRSKQSLAFCGPIPRLFTKGA